MAVTISFEANASGITQTTAQVKANLTSAFAGIQSQMKAMETASGQASAKMSTGLQQLSQQVIRQVAVQGDLSKSFLQTGKAAETQLNQFQRLQQQSLKTEQSTQLLTKSVSLLRTTLSALGVTAGIASIVQFAKSMVDAGLQMERFERTLTAAVGSARGAADAFRFITAESNRLGQSVETMVPIFVQLTAATRNTVLEGERTRALFSALAGAGQAVGLSTEAVGGAMLGLTQIISQNAIQLDEFRNQFASRIPGAMLETAKALKMIGVTQTGTIAEMLKSFERGRISVTDLTRAVTMGLQEIQRTAPSMANSASAAFTQLSNAAFQLKADLARSGLLEFLASMADSARNMIARIREAMGLGGSDFLRQVSDLQGKLSQLRQTRQELLEEAPRSNLESTLRLEGLLGTTQAERLKKLNEEIGLQEERLRKVQEVHNTEKNAEAEKARITQARLQKEAADLKAEDAAAAASRQGAQDAAARARATIGLTQERINQEKIAQDQMQALRERALEQDYDTAVKNTEQTKAAQEQVEMAFAIRRLDISRNTALEDAEIQERTALQTRDVKIAAIKAADAAAQTSAAAPGATAEAQVNANKRSAASAVELQTVTLATQNAMQEAAKKRTEAEATYEKGVSAVIRGERTEQIKITEAQLQREAQLRQQALQGQESILSAETQLVQAQVDGLVLTREEGLARTQTLEREALEVRRSILETQFQEELRQLERRVAANEATEADILAIRARHTQDLEAMNLQQQAQAQEHRNELLQGWIEWVKDVRGALGNFLFRWASGEVRSIKDVLNDLKSYFFRIIADMIAYAATKAIILPIVMSVVGGLGGALGGFGGGGIGQTLGSVLGLANTVGGLGGAGAGTGGSGFGLMQGLGLLGSLKTIGSGFMDALGGLTDTLVNAGSTISTALGGPAIYAPGFVGPVPAGAISTAPGTAAGAALGIAGGAAALGGGIYGALNASNNAARAAFAASAAIGGATAAAGAGLLGAAAATAATTGWTGYGLIAAAVMAVIGTVLDKVIKPEGPTLAVGRPRGLNIGADGGRLQVQGDVGARVFRRDDVDRGLVQSVRTQMEEGITAAAIAAIDTINAIALKPESLLGPTQAALQRALQSVKTLNSSNAKKMENDITEQLRFINLQIVTGMLEPVSLAFDQLRDMGTLEEQIAQLPAKTTGLVDLFKRLNQQISEIAGGKNTDVLRQLSGVRGQVELFGQRIAQTSGQTAENIVNGILEMFQAVKMPTTDAAVETFDEVLAKQVTELATSMSTAFQALSSLRSTQQTLEGAGLAGGAVGTQIDRLRLVVSDQVARVSAEIVDQVLTIMDDAVVPTLTGQITQFSQIMDTSFQALGVLRATQQTLEGQGLQGGGVGAQIDRLTQQMSLTAERIATPIVSGALDSLAAELDEVLIQPIRVQATTVNGLFTDSLVALGALGRERDRLTTAGIDSGQVQKQFERLLTGMLGSAQDLIKDAFATGTLTEFLGVLVSIPEALANLNPEMARLRQVGVAFAQVAGPIQQVIDTVTVDLQTPAERLANTAQQMVDLRQAITDAGDAADRALPLYARLSEAIQANAQLQIEAVNAQADALTEATNTEADALIDVINEWADVAVKDVQSWAEATSDAWQSWADTSTETLNALVEAGQNAIQSWADTNMAGLNMWIAASTKAVNDWAEAATTTASQLETVQRTIMGEMSPAAQREALEGRRARLEDMFRTTGSPAAMNELIGVNQELLSLAKDSDDLALQQRSIDALGVIEDYLTEQLVALTGQSDPVLAQIAIAQTQADRLAEISEIERNQSSLIQNVLAVHLAAIAEIDKAQNLFIQTALTANMEAIAVWQAQQEAAIAARQEQLLADVEVRRAGQLHAIAVWQELTVRAIKEDMVYQLGLIQGELKNLFALQYRGIFGQDLPTVASRTFATGGLIPTRLEPGERVWAPPISMSQAGALSAMNRAFPRFSGGGAVVPGQGSGDSVSAWMPGGSFVLNRNASRAIGYQAGGPVIGRAGGSAEVHHHYHFPSITFREGITLQQFQALMREQERRGLKRNGGA